MAPAIDTNFVQEEREDTKYVFSFRLKRLGQCFTAYPWWTTPCLCARNRVLADTVHLGRGSLFCGKRRCSANSQMGNEWTWFPLRLTEQAFCNYHDNAPHSIRLKRGTSRWIWHTPFTTKEIRTSSEQTSDKINTYVFPGCWIEVFLLFNNLCNNRALGKRLFPSWRGHPGK